MSQSEFTKNSIDSKSRRGISFGVFVLSLIGFCLIAFIGGVLVYHNYAWVIDEYSPIELNRIVETEIKEKPVYMSQLTEERYIDEDAPDGLFQKLLNDSAQHFEFEHQNSNPAAFTMFEQFILVNLENQYSRLSAKFNTEIDHKIQVILIDDIDTFSDHMEKDLEENTQFMAFTQEGDKIEIFINQEFPVIDKFSLAATSSHELVHAFQFEVYRYIFSETEQLTWLYEGMAENWSYPKEDALLKKDVTDRISNLSELNARIMSDSSEEYSIGYAAAEKFFQYLQKEYGEEKLIEIFDQSLIMNTRSVSFNTSFENNIGKTPENVFQEWLGNLD